MRPLPAPSEVIATLDAGMRRPHAPGAVAVLVQICLGMAAHTLVDGCLPSLSVAALMLPVAALAVAAPRRLLRRSSPATRLAAGQALFHASMTLLLPCAGHGSAAAHSHPVPQASVPALLDQLAMPLAHLAVVAVCLLVLHRVERLTATATGRMHALLRRLAARQARPAAPRVVAVWRLIAQAHVTSLFDSWVGTLHKTRAPPAAAR